MKSVEMHLADNIYLTADIEHIDTSFSHEFGYRRQKDIELTNVHIFVDINGEEIDLTNGLAHPLNRQHFLKLHNKLLKIAYESEGGDSPEPDFDNAG